MILLRRPLFLVPAGFLAAVSIGVLADFLFSSSTLTLTFSLAGSGLAATTTALTVLLGSRLKLFARIQHLNQELTEQQDAQLESLAGVLHENFRLYSTVARTFREQGSIPEQLLLLQVTVLEGRARQVAQMDETDYSLFTLRSNLRERGIWSEQDIRTFDEIMDVRNRIVHGDDTSKDAEAIRRAVRDSARLIDSLDGDIRAENSMSV